MSISRRNFILQSLLAAGVFGLASPKSLLAGFQNDNFRELRRNVGIYSNRGGTIGWLINRRGGAVVDTQFPDEARACVEGLKERQRHRGMLNAVINSHHHGDHTGGNAVFADYSDSIISHRKAKEYLQATTEDKKMLPNQVYETDLQLNIGDERIHLNYYGNAHTSGDTVTTFERANIVHMGDLMFNRVHPFIDMGSGANIENWADLLAKVRDNHDSSTIYIFGHGNPEFGVTGSDRDLAFFQDYLEALLYYARRAKEDGKTKEEFVAMETMKGFEDFVSFGARLSLEANLGNAWDEIS